MGQLRDCLDDFRCQTRHADGELGAEEPRGTGLPDVYLDNRYMDKPPRYEYELTEMGRAFYPVILALREWGETWCKSPDEDVAVRYTHLTCGRDAGIGTVCEACGERLRREDLKSELSPSYAQERAARQDAGKVLKSA